MDLRHVLRLERDTRLALVGAGGKTTALFHLARAFEPPVVVTASTHLGEWQSGFADRHLIVTRAEDVLHSAGQIEGVTLFTGPASGDRRLEGLNDEALAALRELADRLHFPLLIEADGSRQRPLKAPAESEPAIPVWVNGVLVVAGLSGLGQPLDEVIAHRPERFSELSGLAFEEPVTPEGLAQVLTSPEGGLKNIPPGARMMALLNQADETRLIEQGKWIGSRILSPFDSVVIAALEQKRIWSVLEPAAGVILAGGGSRRYGAPKLILPWRGKPLIRHVAENALAAGLWPVVTVLGAFGEQVRDGLNGLPVACVMNEDWALGQSTSVRRGVNALPQNTGAALFFLGDQPVIPPDLIRAIIQRHQETLAPIIAPRVAGQRANPVLFDRVTFADLDRLVGDTGGRALFERYPVEYLDWEDANLLLDIDTPEDYDRLKGLE